MVAGLTAVGLVAGCSSSPSSAPATAGTGSATASAGAVDSKAFGSDLVAAMVAARSGRATMSLDTSAAGATAGPAGSLTMAMDFVFNDTKQMNMHATGVSGGQPFEMVVIDGTSYVKSTPPVDGKSWLKLPASGELTSATDPLAMASGFAAASIRKVGTEGPLTHYTLSGVSGQSGDMDVYLDDSGRPAKMVMNSAGVKVDAEYKDWGAAVVVAAPPADQVGDAPAATSTAPATTG